MGLRFRSGLGLGLGPGLVLEGVLRAKARGADARRCAERVRRLRRRARLAVGRHLG